MDKPNKTESGRSLKKLVLRRETVQHLTAKTLEGVRGLGDFGSTRACIPPTVADSINIC